MQGTGNDYLYIDCFNQDIKLSFEQIARLSDRRFGVGGDGVIFVRRSECADGLMDMYNADGSCGIMCGNGVRCVGKFLFDRGRCCRSALIETRGGIKSLEITVGEDDLASGASVEMGHAVIDCQKIPVLWDSCNVDIPIFAAGREWKFTAVSMGNPHAVIFCEENIDGFDLEKIGPEFERHPMFPERMNTEFVNLLDDGALKMRVWERGSGETLACGTGACAVAVAAVQRGLVKTGAETSVRPPGGELSVVVRADFSVRMTGDANEVFTGSVDIPEHGWS